MLNNVNTIIINGAIIMEEELNSGYELNVVHTTKEELETITSKVDTMQRKRNIAKAYRMMIEQR